MPLSEIKPGMKGKAYTVFSGTTVESFDFEVISIQYNARPQWDVIWGKGSGKNLEKVGLCFWNEWQSCLYQRTAHRCYVSYLCGTA